ncbi:MAG: lysylphosphatidylglycerol synthase transmembrane domain-containing protein [Anaerolineales bacterium]
MRRLLTALIVLLAVYLVLSRFTELQQIVDTFGRGHFVWLLLALGLQFGWLVNSALLYKSIYRLLGMPSRLFYLLPLAITSNFINTAAPSGGVGGMAIFINDARRRGTSTARVTIAGVMYVLFDYFGFICVLAVGLVVLFRTHNLTGVELAATAILLLSALALAALLALGVSSPPNFERVLIGAARAVNRLVRPILRRPYLSETRAHEFAAEAREGLAALRTDWREYLPPAGLSLLGKAWLIGILGLTCQAFNVPFDAGTIVAGFSIGFLFTIVSPTPSGIGVVEGAMTVALTSLGVPIGAATVVTLAYRGLTFWLPFAYGFIALRVLEAQWRKHRDDAAVLAASTDEHD